MSSKESNKYGEKPNKHSRKNKKLFKTKSFKIVLILILTVLFLTLGLNIRNLSPSNVVNWVQGTLLGMNKGDGFPADIIGSKINTGNFNVFDNDISYVSDTSFVALNKSAAEDINRQHSFSNPIYKSTNNYALIYNLGGKQFQLEKKSKTEIKSTLGNNIIAGAVSQTGKCAFITESNDYFSEMVVLSVKNGEVKEEYKYYFSEYYITNVAINSDGRSGVASGVYSDEGVIKSAVYIFDFTSEKPKSIIEYPDNMIIDLKYSVSERPVAVFDKSVSIIDTSRQTHNDYSYENKSIVSYEIDDDEVILALSETSVGGNGQVVALNLLAKEKAKFDTKTRIISVSAYSGKIGVLSDSEVNEYTYNGDVKNTLKVSGDSKKIKLMSGGRLYVLGVCKINLLHL